MLYQMDERRLWLEGVLSRIFPLFGYDLKDYEALFDEKLDLLQLVNEKTKLDWQGRLTQTIAGKEVILVQFRTNYPCG